VAGSKREREIARAKFERQQARRAQEAAARRKRVQVVTAVVVVALVLVGAVVLAKTLGSGSSTADAGASTTPSASSNALTASCTYTASGTASKPVSKPPAEASKVPATRTATITLNGSPVTVQLFAAKAPCTVNSFAHLADAKYFDGTTCHRLTKSATLSVLQCGDPSATGSGGPGYSFADENLTGATYKKGTVAMANAGANTNGSQFFLVYADSSLPPSYTPFGAITSGLDVVTKIAAAGVSGGGSDGAPAKPVKVTTVVVAKG
jgi:peptidyl-prolyl cis-trans isomerase B (cyclophilin B)